MDLESFKTQYHYKTDLVALCRQYHLPTSGTKAVLTQRLLDYLSGRPVTQPAGPSAHHQPLASHTLSLETPIVGSGFAFNQAARQFFTHYFTWNILCLPNRWPYLSGKLKQKKIRPPRLAI